MNAKGSILKLHTFSKNLESEIYNYFKFIINSMIHEIISRQTMQ